MRINKIEMTFCEDCEDCEEEFECDEDCENCEYNDYDEDNDYDPEEDTISEYVSRLIDAGADPEFACEFVLDIWNKAVQCGFDEHRDMIREFNEYTE